MTTLYGIPFAVRDPEDGCHVSLFEKESHDGVHKIGLKLSYDTPVVPKPVKLGFTIPNKNVLTTYAPLIGQDRLTRSVRPDWHPYRLDSRLSGGIPLISMIGHDEKNYVTAALSDCKTPLSFSVGLIEETAELHFRIELFTMSGGLVSDYESEIMIDTRPRGFTAAIEAATEYLFAVNGIRPAYMPDAAARPMYSAWYSYHQAVDTESMLKECRLAKALGMEAIIIDDGWQTDDVNRGYSYCGDWEITKNKIPDIHALVDGIHRLGMKVIFWYSVPFVGPYTKAYKQFGDMLLTSGQWGKTHPWKMIDPRYPEARRFLIDKYITAVRDWGLDGLKLDFIDSYQLSADSPLSDPRMDTCSLFDALDSLMTEVREALQAINPEVLLEFRQAYVGPYMQTYGNMFRVGDCPQDSLTNRISAIDMRLSMRHVAIHSDMLMWHREETAETAARQLLNIFFTVPQISVRLQELPEAHTAMLRHYLGLWNDCRDTLLWGDFLPEGVDGSYSMLTVTGERESFCFAFSKNICRYEEKKPLYYMNVTRGDVLYLELSSEKRVEVYDCTGTCIRTYPLSSGIHRLEVPMSGMAVVK